MIGKIIQMHRPRAKRGALVHQPPIAHLRDSVFALTRYIVDANPHALIQQEGNILALTDYALAMKHAGSEPGEKVEAHGARNLVGDDLLSWQAQMLAVAARAPKVRAPLTHIILSLHEGERWTEHQRDEAITLVLETLGLERCQTVWAEHSNTANPHRRPALSAGRRDAGTLFRGESRRGSTIREMILSPRDITVSIKA